MNKCICAQMQGEMSCFPRLRRGKAAPPGEVQIINNYMLTSGSGYSKI